MPAPTQKTPALKEGSYTVSKVDDLNYFDLTGEKAKTKGSSNKSYHLELQEGNNKFQLFSMYGPTGGSQVKEYRVYTSSFEANKDYDSIIKSKLKKGYTKIDVAQRALGSKAAKEIVKPVVFNNAPAESTACSLPLPTQNLISKLFGATSQWVATTLQCPLGQLTNAQIDKGRATLTEAKDILNSKKITPGVKADLQELTNQFYATIPHNLGSGKRGQLTHLLLDSLDKVVAKEQDLDTLLDAKSVGAVLNKDNAVEAQYKELEADLTWIDPKEDIHKFIDGFFQNSKIAQHGFKSAKIVNLWKLDRKGRESEWFLENSKRIAGECGKHVMVKEISGWAKKAADWVPDKRPDLDAEIKELFNKANTWLCWHGTRSANVIGITKKSLLIRPAGSIHTGSMFGDAVYKAVSSTKSLNYCDGGHWTGGKRSDTKFMFLSDSTFGNMYIAPGPHYYRSPPKGYHSVYGKKDVSGVINDEIMLYKTGKDTQFRLRYLLEVED